MQNLNSEAALRLINEFSTRLKKKLVSFSNNKNYYIKSKLIFKSHIWKTRTLTFFLLIATSFGIYKTTYGIDKRNFKVAQKKVSYQIHSLILDSDKIQKFNHSLCKKRATNNPSLISIDESKVFYSDLVRCYQDIESIESILENEKYIIFLSDNEIIDLSSLTSDLESILEPYVQGKTNVEQKDINQIVGGFAFLANAFRKAFKINIGVSTLYSIQHHVPAVKNSFTCDYNDIKLNKTFENGTKVNYLVGN